jgi:hypothetical protein
VSTRAIISIYRLLYEGALDHLSVSERAVLLALANFYRLKSRRSNPKAKTLMKVTALSRSTVLQCLRALKETHKLIISKRPGSRYAATQYDLSPAIMGPADGRMKATRGPANDVQGSSKRTPGVQQMDHLSLELKTLEERSLEATRPLQLLRKEEQSSEECFKCGRPGHRQNHCPENPVTAEYKAAQRSKPNFVGIGDGAASETKPPVTNPTAAPSVECEECGLHGPHRKTCSRRIKTHAAA